MKPEDLALLAYVRVCAEKYPNMAVGRCVKLASQFAEKHITEPAPAALNMRQAPLGDRRFIGNKPLTHRQIEALRIIIDLHTANAGATRGALAQAMGVAIQSAMAVAKPLLRGGFIQEIKKPNKKFSRPKVFYIPLKDEHGALLTKPEVRTEGGVTKCPPGYAFGYGFDRHAFGTVNKRGA